MSRALALDFGERRCGVAVSDPSRTIVTPREVIEHPASDDGLEAIVRLCDENGVDHVVIGLPMSLSGTESEQTGSTRRFAAVLATRLPDGVGVSLVDERLSTSEARRLGGNAAEDSRAAAVLLEHWLRSEGSR